MLRLAVPLAVILGIWSAAPALADSVAAEQQQGAQVLAQVRHGTVNPRSLTGVQYQQLGEYLMGRALGSTGLHQRMNTLMDEMMGPAAADRMHVYLAERYLGISATPARGDAALYGLMGTMMSGYRGSPLAGMMSAYLNGQGTAGYTMMGYRNAGSGAWPMAAIIATILLGALLIALVAPRLRRRAPRVPHSAT